jgi:TolB-like protein
MKISLGLFCIVILSACSTQSDDGFYDGYRNQFDDQVVEKKEIDSNDLPKHNLNEIVKGMAYEMMENSAFVNHKTPIAIASFVNMENFDEASWLGNQIAESFIHEFQRHGLIVIDFKSTGYFRVTQDGDFAFSRNWEELPENQIIDYVVSGTLLEQEDGYIVNARMIGMLSHVVVASAQTFIPKWALGNEKKVEDNTLDGIEVR